MDFDAINKRLELVHKRVQESTPSQRAAINAMQDNIDWYKRKRREHMERYREGDKYDMTIAEGDCIPQVCDDCSEPLLGKGHETGDNEGVVCSDCFDHYTECPRCGMNVHQDDIGGPLGWCEICRGD